MATQTTSLKLSKPAYSDTADISVINTNMDTIDTAVSKILPVISGTTNNSGYAISAGEYFEANGSLYKASASIPTGNAWSSSATAQSDHGAVNAVNSKITPVSQSFSPNQSPRTLSASVLACSFILFTIARYGYADSVLLPSSIVTSTLGSGVKLMYNANQITLSVNNSSNQIVLSGTGSGELNVYVHGYM